MVSCYQIVSHDPPRTTRHWLYVSGLRVISAFNSVANVTWAYQTGSKVHPPRFDVLEQVGIENAADLYPHELSGGQQQRVALARALAPNPAVILLDEPYAGLDSRLRERIRDEMLHVLKAANAVALMVTHDAEEAMFMSDRIVVLRDGKWSVWSPS